MGSSGKRKTTMAKLNRERKLQERRRDKAARKDARRSAPEPSLWGAALSADAAEPEGADELTATPDGAAPHDLPATPDGARDLPATPDGAAPHEPA